MNGFSRKNVNKSTADHGAMCFVVVRVNLNAGRGKEFINEKFKAILVLSGILFLQWENTSGSSM